MHGAFTFVYRAGQRVLHVVGNDGRWRASVDGAIVDGTFATKTAAWAAGLAELRHIERFAASASETTGKGGKQA